MKIRNFIMGAILTNCYFLIPENSDRIILIDPGMDGEGIHAKLQEKGLTPRFILLTHGHFDHAMGAAYLREKTGAQVVVHQADTELLSDPEKSGANLYYGSPLLSYPACPVDLPVSHGDRITLEEIDLRVIHTPGHTKGSVCFDTGEELFCGDTLFRSGFGRTDLYGGSSQTLADSLQALADLPGERRLYPGHGSSSRLSVERGNVAYYVRRFG